MTRVAGGLIHPASEDGGSRHRPRVAGHGLGLAAYAAGGRTRTVHRSSRLRADRRDPRSGALRATGERTRPTLGGRLGASRLEPGNARRASRPLKSAVGGETLRLAHNCSSAPRRAVPLNKGFTKLDITPRTSSPGFRQATSTRGRSAIAALVGGGCTSAEPLTCSTNAADELARRGCGRDRDRGDDARATPPQAPL